jgi:hypothetical protein
MTLHRIATAAQSARFGVVEAYFWRRENPLFF